MRSLALLPLIAACGGGVADWYTDQPWSWRQVDVSVAPVFDPKLQGDPQLQIQVAIPAALPPSCTVDLTATTVAGYAGTLAQIPAPEGPDGAIVTWDGTLGGLPADPGPVQIAAELRCTERLAGFGEAWTHIVRLGPSALDFRGEAKVPLAWHKADLVTRRISLWPDDRAEWALHGHALDALDGLPQDPPPPWHDPHTPPWGPGEPSELAARNLPIAYPAGERFTVWFTPGVQARSARSQIPLDVRGPAETHDDLPTLRVVAEGLHAEDPTWAPGEPIAFESLEDTLPTTLGRHELELTWRFEAQVDDAWVEVPGSLTTTHRLYVLAGPTAVLNGIAFGASPPASWVGVLEDVRPAVQGLPADDPVAALDALRDHLYTNAWYIYNPNDSSYSSFSGSYIYWNRIWTEMSDFLDRTQGLNLYCHSVACLLASQANHYGIEAEYVTIVHRDHPTARTNFRTWMTRAAGRDDWRRWTFNSHGVTGFDDLIWDAAVDIDGGDDPGSEPVEPYAPKAMPFQDYLELLTADPMVQVNGGRCYNY
ncbi:MAG: hypothetical protein EA397_14950 [Deltaproteobacteria bacterium]|nr:MAG: hypothetical protein EA397_14950 [Deltaproteobacteria bacterium]